MFSLPAVLLMFTLIVGSMFGGLLFVAHRSNQLLSLSAETWSPPEGGPASEAPGIAGAKVFRVGRKVVRFQSRAGWVFFGFYLLASAVAFADKSLGLLFVLNVGSVGVMGLHLMNTISAVQFGPGNAVTLVAPLNSVTVPYSELKELSGTQVKEGSLVLRCKGGRYEINRPVERIDEMIAQFRIANPTMSVLRY